MEAFRGRWRRPETASAEEESRGIHVEWEVQCDSEENCMINNAVEWPQNASQTAQT